MFESPVWRDAVEHARQGTLHFIGLHSDGNVHSHLDHLYAMLRGPPTRASPSAAVHILLDGRDVPARSALHVHRPDRTRAGGDQRRRRRAATSGSPRAAVGCGSRWTATGPTGRWSSRGYQAHTYGVGRPVRSGRRGRHHDVRRGRAAGAGHGRPVPRRVRGRRRRRRAGRHDRRRRRGRSIFNFRGDRAIEISRAYEETDFAEFDRTGPAGAADAQRVPAGHDAVRRRHARPQALPGRAAGDRPHDGRSTCATNGSPQLAISETQKYGHVTYFWNGNRCGYFDPELETYIEIPSDNVAFDTTPGMKAARSPTS